MEDFEEMAEEAEESEKSDGLQEALEVERRAIAALEVALKNEKVAKARYKAALKQERKVNEALATTLRKKQAENNSLRVEVDNLKKSQKDQQRSKIKLRGATATMIAEIQQDKKFIEKLQKDLEASSYQHEKDSAERHLVNCAEVKTLKDSLIEQQEESLGKDDAIQSLHFNIQKLQSDIEANDTIVSTLQENVNQWASDLNEEQTKKCSVQRDYETAISQQLKEAEELDHVTCKNQLLTSENKRLQSELAAVLNESQLHRKQLQDDREARSRHGEAIEKEKDRSLRTFTKIQIQKKELSQRTLAFEKSLISGKLLQSSLRSEKKLFDQMKRRL
ncbi:hypothetical protein EYF80_014147 [Liparis tanakae]|uniref:Uncharacterized protein n=1 Tax=Liparis tanakae TaxID=230148 RepID=A0A4Z2ICH8_9TELE|nr:hypothetical protein EYF80_014147 [Liparis tanakae]